MASNNFMQRVGHSSCIRCDFETDDAMSFAEQDAAMMAHLADKHPNWEMEKLTPEQESRLAARYQDPRDKRIAALEQENGKLIEELSLWRSEHDPCPFSIELEQLRAEIAKLKQPVSDAEWPKTWDGYLRPSITRSAVNALLAVRSQTESGK
jgi:hypothetical protein